MGLSGFLELMRTHAADACFPSIDPATERADPLSYAQLAETLRATDAGVVDMAPVYLEAAARMGAEDTPLALFAAHAWDRAVGPAAACARLATVVLVSPERIPMRANNPLSSPFAKRWLPDAPALAAALVAHALSGCAAGRLRLTVVLHAEGGPPPMCLRYGADGSEWMTPSRAGLVERGQAWPRAGGLVLWTRLLHARATPTNVVVFSRDSDAAAALLLHAASPARPRNAALWLAVSGCALVHQYVSLVVAGQLLRMLYRPRLVGSVVDKDADILAFIVALALCLRHTGAPADWLRGAGLAELLAATCAAARDRRLQRVLTVAGGTVRVNTQALRTLALAIEPAAALRADREYAAQAARLAFWLGDVLNAHVPGRPAPNPLERDATTGRALWGFARSPTTGEVVPTDDVAEQSIYACS